MIKAFTQLPSLHLITIFSKEWASQFPLQNKSNKVIQVLEQNRTVIAPKITIKLIGLRQKLGQMSYCQHKELPLQAGEGRWSSPGGVTAGHWMVNHGGTSQPCTECSMRFVTDSGMWTQKYTELGKLIIHL